MRMTRFIFAALLTPCCLQPAHASEPPNNPADTQMEPAPLSKDFTATLQPDPEAGRVRWSRDFAAATGESRRTGKPIFLTFQEIPGCATCVGFGGEPLSNPLLIAAIEESFVPLLIHNNKPGPDAEVLRRFDEPAWNNPVVRFVDTDGTDLIPRRDGVWDTAALARRTRDALSAAQRPVPRYLPLLIAESDSDSLQRATFAMACYWHGEAELGSIDGVITTRAALLGGQEVVELTFDPDQVSYETLLKAARTRRCATMIFARSQAQFDEASRISPSDTQRTDEVSREASLSDQHYYLGHSSLRFLPLTPAQATKINAALGTETRDGLEYLTASQRALLTRIDARLRRDPRTLDSLARPQGLSSGQEWDAHLASLEAALR